MAGAFLGHFVSASRQLQDKRAAERR